MNFNVASSHPAISQDGLTLHYSAGITPEERLYQATRASRNEPFGTAQSLGDLVGNQALESPSLSSNGLTLFFTVWDPAYATNDIYQATRNSVGDPWGNVVMLSSAINVPGYNDAMPSISSDGLMLYFNSNRPGGFGDFDLYVSTRESLDAPWANAVNLGPQVNTAYDDKGPSISADGSLLYFHSNRPGGFGADDVYQVAILGEAPDAKFYVVNDGGNAVTDRTYEYDNAGTPGESYSVATGNTAPRGAASTAAGDKVWVVDANKNVYVYNASGGLLGSWTAGALARQRPGRRASPPTAPTSGSSMPSSDKVYRYAGAASRLSGSQNAASSFSLEQRQQGPQGHRHRRRRISGSSTTAPPTRSSSTRSPVRSSEAGRLPTGGGSPTGITIDPANVSDIWIVDNATDRVYQYTAAASRTSGSQSAASQLRPCRRQHQPARHRRPACGLRRRAHDE